MSVGTLIASCSADALHENGKVWGCGWHASRWTEQFTDDEDEAALNAREELVLRLRFGRLRTVQSRDQVARFLGVSGRTVRCIERRALRKLRMDAIERLGPGGPGWDEA